MNTLLLAATSAFLFVAPFPGSAGLRASLLVLAGIALLARPAAVREGLRIFPRGVAIAFGAWCALAIASLAWSVQPRYTLAELKAEILYGAIALATFHVAALADPGRWRAWARALLAGAALLAAWFVIQDWLPFILPKQTLAEQRGPWSTHLVMVAPMLLVLCWSAPWGEARAAWVQAVALAVFLAAAWTTGNRVMWLALAVQLAVVIALARRAPLPVAARAGASRRLAIAAVAAVVLAFGASLVEHNERFFGADAPLATSFERDLRPRIWSVAVEQVMQAPWLGHGYGREIVAPAFSPLTPPRYPELRHAHNVFLDAAIELGLAGALVLVALFVALAREYRACLMRAETAPLGVIGLALVAGFVVKCLTDDFMYRHNALVFWALNGALLGLARTPPRPPRHAEPAPP
jgi:O-antigen ligase